MYNEINQEDYIPGTCNIGRAEISRRLRYGYFGVGTALLMMALLLIFDIDRGWRGLVFIPVAVGLTGLLQATQRFCLAYGFKGVFSTAANRKYTKVFDEAFLKEDRKTAMRLVVKIMIGTLIVTLIFYFLPW